MATKNTSPKPKPEFRSSTKLLAGMKKFLIGTKKVFNGMIPSSTGMKKCLTGTTPGLTEMKKVFAGAVPASTEMKKCLTEMIPAKNFVVPTHPGMKTGDSGLLKFSPLTVKMRLDVLKLRYFWLKGHN